MATYETEYREEGTGHFIAGIDLRIDHEKGDMVTINSREFRVTTRTSVVSGNTFVRQFWCRDMTPRKRRPR